MLCILDAEESDSVYPFSDHTSSIAWNKKWWRLKPLICHQLNDSITHLVDDMIKGDNDVVHISVLWVQQQQTKQFAQFTFCRQPVLFHFLSVIRVTPAHVTAEQ